MKINFQIYFGLNLACSLELLILLGTASEPTSSSSICLELKLRPKLTLELSLVTFMMRHLAHVAHLVEAEVEVQVVRARQRLPVLEKGRIVAVHRRVANAQLHKTLLTLLMKTFGDKLQCS